MQRNNWLTICFVEAITLSAFLLQVSNGFRCKYNANNSDMIETTMMLCIAECLELTESSTATKKNKTPCFYNSKSGTVANLNCSKTFVPSTQKDKKIILCDYIHEPGANISASRMSLCDVINFKNLTYFDKPKDTLRITHSGAYLDQILKIKSEATLAGIKTTFQVGSFFEYEGMEPETIGLVAGNPEKRTKFLSKVLEISKKYEFDGVTLVWLFPGCPQLKCSSISRLRDRAKMVPFLSELGKTMKNEGKLSIFFSLTNDASINWFLGDFYSNVTEFVDYFIMECESQSTIGSPRIALPANLQVAQENVKMLMEKTTGVYNKLLLSFNPASLNFRLIGQGNTLGSGHSPLHNEHYMHYSRLCKWMRDDNVKRVRNSSTQNFAYKNLLAYDDYESLKAKVDELIVANGLAGVHVKSINGDDLSDVCGCGVAPYTRMIAELLKGGEDCKPNRCI